MMYWIIQASDRVNTNSFESQFIIVVLHPKNIADCHNHI